MAGRRLFSFLVRSIFLALIAILRQLQAFLEDFLVLARMMSRGLANRTLHFDQVVLRHIDGTSTGTINLTVASLTFKLLTDLTI